MFYKKIFIQHNSLKSKFWHKILFFYYILSKYNSFDIKLIFKLLFNITNIHSFYRRHSRVFRKILLRLNFENKAFHRFNSFPSIPKKLSIYPSFQRTEPEPKNLLYNQTHGTPLTYNFIRLFSIRAIFKTDRKIYDPSTLCFFYTLREKEKGRFSDANFHVRDFRAWFMRFSRFTFAWFILGTSL